MFHFSPIPPPGEILTIQLTSDACAGQDNEVRYVEHVQAIISARATRRGDMTINITSPSGTESILLARRPFDDDSQQGPISNSRCKGWTLSKWFVCRVPRVAVPDYPHVGGEPGGCVDSDGGDEVGGAVESRRTSRVEARSARNPEGLHLKTHGGASREANRRNSRRQKRPHRRLKRFSTYQSISPLTPRYSGFNLNEDSETNSILQFTSFLYQKTKKPKTKSLITFLSMMFAVSAKYSPLHFTESNPGSRVR